MDDLHDGAHLGVVEAGPLPLDHPLIEMENVILSPHALARTDDLYELNGSMACESLLALFRGELPAYPVNREVIGTQVFQAKLRGMAARWEALAGQGERQREMRYPDV